MRFRLPEACIHCRAAGTVVPEMTVAGGAVIFAWHCRTCGLDWPITDVERQLPERRTGEPDRRQNRVERRQAQSRRRRRKT